jgi:hypothetical protein
MVASKGSRSVLGRGRGGLGAPRQGPRPPDHASIRASISGRGLHAPLIRFGVVPEVVQVEKPCSLEAIGVQLDSKGEIELLEDEPKM